MHDEFLRAWIGQLFGEPGQDAESLIEFANAEETGIGNEPTALKSDGDLLRAEVPKHKLCQTACHHDLEPFGCSKSLFSCNLFTTRGSFFKNTVRYSG